MGPSPHPASPQQAVPARPSIPTRLVIAQRVPAQRRWVVLGALALAVPVAVAAGWMAGRGLRARKPLVPSHGAFVCTELEGRDLVEGTELRVTFNEGWMDVFAGCNNLTGSVYASGTRLFWSEDASTEVGCRPDLAVQDAWLSGWLNAGVDVFRDHGRLVFSGQGVRAVLVPAGRNAS